MDSGIFSRTERLIGASGLERLRRSCVWVFGLGGVGSACAESLVRSGVGSFLFVDKDRVEPSNLNRQAIAFRSTIGMRKVDVMEKMAHDINEDASVQTLDAFIRRETIEGQLQGFADPDYIVDAFDTLTAKVAIGLYAQSRGVPCVSSAGGANKVDLMSYRVDRLQDTKVCPLCRELRKIARDNGLTELDILYSTEPSMKVIPDPTSPRSEKTELGTMSYVPPAMGLMIAGFVVQRLLERE